MQSSVHLTMKTTNNAGNFYWYRGGSSVMYYSDALYVDKFVDKGATSYYLDPGSTSTSLNVAGAIQLPDAKAIMWAGNNIISHNGTQTYIGDNVSSSTVTITGGNATFAGDVTVNGGDVTIAKQNDAPTMILLHDGTNPSTNDLLFRMQFQSDYNIPFHLHQAFHQLSQLAITS